MKVFFYYFFLKKRRDTDKFMTSNYIIGLDGIPGRSGLDGNFISVKIMGNFYLIK